MKSSRILILFCSISTIIFWNTVRGGLTEDAMLLFSGMMVIAWTIADATRLISWSLIYDGLKQKG
jgi:hypothetical protein